MRKFIMALPLLLLWACSQNDVVKIEGEISNAEGKTLYLDRLHVAHTESIDSVTLKKDGHFKFKIESDKPEFYLVRLSNGKLVTLLTEPGQRINMTASATNLDRKYNVTGSKGSQLVKGLNMQLFDTKEKLDAIKDEVTQKRGDKDFEQLFQKLSKKYQDVIMAQRQYSSDFIMKNATSLASYMALFQKVDKNTYTLNENEDIKFVKIVASSMKALYPQSEYTVALLNNLDEMQKRLNNLKIKELISQVGISYPEIELPNIKDDKVKLSSLKGKFIVLNFWSAQDPNAGKINKTLKKIYRRYHNRGLEIYQVSVDTNKPMWQNAVKREQLNWINVCEPKNGSALAVQTYNVQKVPTIYLISKKGEIVGKNLFGNDLEDKIKELLK